MTHSLILSSYIGLCMAVLLTQSKNFELTTSSAKHVVFSNAHLVNFLTPFNFLLKCHLLGFEGNVAETSITPLIARVDSADPAG